METEELVGEVSPSDPALVSWDYVTPQPKRRVLGPEDPVQVMPFETLEPAPEVDPSMLQGRTGTAVAIMVMVGLACGALLAAIVGAASIWLGG